MCVTNRKIPAVLVAMFSSITLLLAMVMIVLSFRFNETLEQTSGKSDFDSYTNSAFIMLLTASLIAFFSGIFGLMLFCIKSRFCAVIFGCLLMPAATCVFVFGMSIATISNTDESTLRQFCSDDPNYEAENDSKYITNARENVANADKIMGEFVSKQMCSRNCPCYALDHEDIVTQWTEMSESDLNQYGRTLEE